MLPKISSSIKKNQIFRKLLIVLLLLMLLFLEAATHKCSTKQVFPSFCFNEVAGRPPYWNFIEKEILAQMFLCKFCNVSLWIYGTPPPSQLLLLHRFGEVLIEKILKKTFIRSFFLDTTNIYIIIYIYIYIYIIYIYL